MLTKENHILLLESKAQRGKVTDLGFVIFDVRIVVQTLGKSDTQTCVLYKEINTRTKFSCRGERLLCYLCPSLLPSEKLNPQDHLRITMLIQRPESVYSLSNLFCHRNTYSMRNWYQEPKQQTIPIKRKFKTRQT